ncbi:MAG: transcription antitermination factor NusB [Oscillospiraceae bacterium]|jgi:N utilization substance protein B|nr:transcription antitermination factor NusB [Oscillospiraceae bacterium]
MSRKKSREAAFQFLYQLEFRTDDPAPQREAFLESNPLQEKDLEYFDLIVSGVTDNKAELDASFSPFLIGWKLDRIPKVDLAILRIACYEILHIESIPSNVSISEAVILAKQYSTEESKSYINAILGRIDSGKTE